MHTGRDLKLKTWSIRCGAMRRVDATTLFICFPNIDIGFKLIPNLDNVRKRSFYENLSGSR